MNRLNMWLTCNWLAIGFHCWRKGHDYRTQRPTRCVEISVCAYCGIYRGASIPTEDERCRWCQPTRMQVTRLPKLPDLS